MQASWPQGKCAVFQQSDGLLNTATKITKIKRGSAMRAWSNPGVNKGETLEAIFICDLETSEWILFPSKELETVTAQEGP